MSELDPTVEYIDMTPTWTAVMPILLTALEQGTPVGKEAARGELMRLAKEVDRINAKAKEDRVIP